MWEHQRFFPVRGWTSTLPTERKRFARNEDGSGSQHKFPQVDPPEGERQCFHFFVAALCMPERIKSSAKGRRPQVLSYSWHAAAGAMTPVLMITP